MTGGELPLILVGWLPLGAGRGCSREERLVATVCALRESVFDARKGRYSDPQVIAWNKTCLPWCSPREKEHHSPLAENITSGHKGCQGQVKIHPWCVQNALGCELPCAKSLSRAWWL